MTIYHHLYPRYGGVLAPPGAHTIPFKDSKYLKRHSVQCKAKCRDGHRCKRYAVIGPLCWTHAKSVDHLRIQTSAIENAGNGMYVTKYTPANTNIADYKGEFKDASTYRKKDDPYALRDGKIVIVPKRSSDSFGYYVNAPRGHPSWKNARFSVRSFAPGVMGHRRFEVHVKTTRAIPAGNEVFMNYGRSYNWRLAHH